MQAEEVLVGVLYSVFPLDAKSRTGLARYGVKDVPVEDGRNPTPADVREALAELSEFRADDEVATASESWCVTVELAGAPEEGPWTHLRASPYVAENEPVELSFEKGWPDLVVRIMARLAERCGTLVLVPDTGEAPLVVPSGADPKSCCGNGSTERIRWPAALAANGYSSASQVTSLSVGRIQPDPSA
jgi:hypothetical protein